MEASEVEVQRLRESMCALVELSSGMLGLLSCVHPELRGEALRLFQRTRLECRDHEVGVIWDREIEGHGQHAQATT